MRGSVQATPPTAADELNQKPRARYTTTKARLAYARRVANRPYRFSLSQILGAWGSIIDSRAKDAKWTREDLAEAADSRVTKRYRRYEELPPC